LAQVLQLDDHKRLLKQYYAGHQMESPTGGFLMMLGVRPVADGSALAIFECSASSLRYELPIPKATRTERKNVKDQLDARHDADCPRHGRGHELVRAGRDMVCTACGIPYAKV